MEGTLFLKLSVSMVAQKNSYIKKMKKLMRHNKSKNDLVFWEVRFIPDAGKNTAMSE